MFHLTLTIYVIHTFQSLLTGVLLMRGYFPNDNVLERNNPKKRAYKRHIAAGKLTMACLAFLALLYGVDTNAVRHLVSPTLCFYHVMSNLIQWNTVYSTTSAIVSPHLFLALGFAHVSMS
jgi:hypothetical protein